MVHRGKRLNLSQSQLAEMLNVSTRTITRWSSEKSLSVTKKKKAVPPHIRLRRSNVVKIAKQVGGEGRFQHKKFGCASAIRAELHATTAISVSRKSIQRDLRAAGAKCYVRPRVSTRSATDYQARREYAKKHKKIAKKRWTFSDESIVTANEQTGRYEWCFDNERPFPIEKKSRFNVSAVQVWGCVGHGWRSELVVLPAKRTTADGDEVSFRLNKETYVRRCLSKIAEELRTGRRVFVQDGARCHDNKHVRAYCERKGIEVVQLPPYSPDLNLIEVVWGLLKAELGKLYPTDVNDLIKKVKIAWNRIPQSTIDKMIEKYPNMLERLEKNDGRAL